MHTHYSQFSGLFFICTYFCFCIFHINIVSECIMLRCIVKNKHTYFLNYLCAAKAALPCEINGKVYKDGEEFNMNCSFRCSCQNGQYACSTLCPHEIRPPSTSNCRAPQVGAFRFVSASATSVMPNSSIRYLSDSRHIGTLDYV